MVRGEAAERSLVGRRSATIARLRCAGGAVGQRRAGTTIQDSPKPSVEQRRRAAERAERRGRDEPRRRGAERRSRGPLADAAALDGASAAAREAHGKSTPSAMKSTDAAKIHRATARCVLTNRASSALVSARDALDAPALHAALARRTSAAEHCAARSTQ
jgi:hypothetical protein